MPAWSTGASPLTAGSGISITSAGVISATGGGLPVMTVPTAAQFTTVFNNGVDSEAIADFADEKGVRFSRAGATNVLTLTGGGEAIATGNYAVTVGMVVSLKGGRAHQGSIGQTYGCGLSLVDGDGNHGQFVLGVNDSGVQLSINKWTDEDTYSSNPDNAAFVAGVPYSAASGGLPIYLRVQKDATNFEFYYSATGLVDSWVHLSGFTTAHANLVPGAVTLAGPSAYAITGAAGADCPVAQRVFHWSNA